MAVKSTTKNRAKKQVVGGKKDKLAVCAPQKAKAARKELQSAKGEKEEAFLDFDELAFEVDESDSRKIKHPLNDVLLPDEKGSYVGGLVFGAKASFNTISQEKKSAIYGVARSIGVMKKDVDALFSQIEALRDKIGYLKDICKKLHDREKSLFWVLDLRLIMGGCDLGNNAKQLLSAAYKLLALNSSDVHLVESFGKVAFKDGNWTKDELEQKFFEEEDEVAKKVCEWFEPSAFSAALFRKSTNEFSEQLAKTRTEIDKNFIEMAVMMPFKMFMFENDSSSIWVGDDCIPVSKRANARESMHVLEPEHILQIDTTLFGSSKDGLVITNRALYYKNSFEEPVRIPWKKLTRCSKEGSDIYFENFGKFSCVVGSDHAVDAFFKALCEVINKLQANPDKLDVE